MYVQYLISPWQIIPTQSYAIIIIALRSEVVYYAQYINK